MAISNPTPNPTPERIREALLAGNKELFLLDNLIATGYAIIQFLYLTPLDGPTKYAFFELEKRFRMYAELLES